MQVMRLWIVAAKGANECCGICGERRGNCAAFFGLSLASHLSTDAASVAVLKERWVRDLEGPLSPRVLHFRLGT
jgi:hypothetical protein